MAIKINKKWSSNFFNAEIKLLSYQPVLGPVPFYKYKSSLLETWPNLYKDKSDIELLKKHSQYEDHKKKFLGICKPGETFYTRPLILEKNQNRLFVCISKKDSTDYDYEFVLISIRKLPFLKEESIECAVYKSTRIYHDVPGRYHVGQLPVGTFSLEFNEFNSTKFSIFGISGTLAKSENASLQVE